jgi:hypothetical protein
VCLTFEAITITRAMLLWAQVETKEKGNLKGEKYLEIQDNHE